jgi:hypothetical protein
MPTKINYKQETSYPVQTVEDLLVNIDNNEKMLDALVDIVNRSEYAVGEWASHLDIPINEFIDTCHRVRPVSIAFRDKVHKFFKE